jgi:hypothetical protein
MYIGITLCSGHEFLLQYQTAGFYTIQGLFLFLRHTLLLASPSGLWVPGFLVFSLYLDSEHIPINNIIMHYKKVIEKKEIETERERETIFLSALHVL